MQEHEIRQTLENSLDELLVLSQGAERGGDKWLGAAASSQEHNEAQLNELAHSSKAITAAIQQAKHVSDEAARYVMHCQCYTLRLLWGFVCVP